MAPPTILPFPFPRPARGIALLALLLLAILHAPLPAHGDAAQIASEASRLLAQAGESLQQASTGRDRRRALARAIRAYETGLIAANAGLSALNEQASLRAKDLAAKGKQMSDIQTALYQIEATPPELRHLHPGGPVAAARAAMLMADMQQALAARATDLKADLDALSTLQALQQTFADDIRRASAELAAARQDLMAGGQIDADPLTGDLGRASRDLASLAQTLTGQPEPPAPDVAPEGDWIWPAAGTIRRSFGEEDAAGIARPGLILMTAQGAVVSAPMAATVRYTGTFLDHGQMIILAPDAQRLLILTGLHGVFVAPGTRVSAMEPLGVMPGGDMSDEEFLIKFGNGDDAFLNQSLYVEFRRSGIATDPAGLFAPTGMKGSK